MLRITKQHAWVVYELGEKVLFKKNPAFVDVLWVEIEWVDMEAV